MRSYLLNYNTSYRADCCWQLGITMPRLLVFKTNQTSPAHEARQQVTKANMYVGHAISCHWTLHNEKYFVFQQRYGFVNRFQLMAPESWLSSFYAFHYRQKFLIANVRIMILLNLNNVLVRAVALYRMGVKPLPEPFRTALRSTCKQHIKALVVNKENFYFVRSIYLHKTFWWFLILLLASLLLHIQFQQTNTMTSCKRHVVSNHRSFDYLFNSLCGPTSNKYQNAQKRWNLSAIEYKYWYLLTEFLFLNLLNEPITFKGDKKPIRMILISSGFSTRIVNLFEHLHHYSVSNIQTLKQCCHTNRTHHCL